MDGSLFAALNGRDSLKRPVVQRDRQVPNKPNMHFKFEYTVPDMEIEESQPCTVVVPGVRSVAVTLERLRRPRADGTQTSATVATAWYELTLARNIDEVFQSISRGEIPNGGAPTDDWMPFVDAFGKVNARQVLPTDLFPAGARTVIDEVRSELSSAIKSVVRTIRWRQGVWSGSDRFISRLEGALWSIDGQSWGILPAVVHITFDEPRTIDLSYAARLELDSLLGRSIAEPLGHEILREARELQHAAPRSAVLMMVAALEIGTKGVITALQPQTTWLVDNLQAPPVSRLIEEYLPKLPFRGEAEGLSLSIPKPILDRVKKLVLVRNRLAHTGLGGFRIQQLQEYLLLVGDFLWLYDYLTGHGWAARYVSAARRTALGVKVASA